MPGFEILRSQAEDKVKELTKKLLVDFTKIAPSELMIEDVIAIQYEIKGMEWWIKEVEKLKNKEKDV